MMSCEDTQPMLRAHAGSELGFHPGRAHFKRRPATQLVRPVGPVEGAMVDPLRWAEAEPPLAHRCENCRNAVILTVFTAAMVGGWAVGLLVGPF
jgi:hypothetical protein